MMTHHKTPHVVHCVVASGTPRQARDFFFSFVSLCCKKLNCLMLQILRYQVTLIMILHMMNDLPDVILMNYCTVQAQLGLHIYV